ncbi:hemin uptake protein HemP [Aestuariivirga sp.]|uniref:hemin uptake protein HemP n=1 Tax=Aestuariivirga sp. TaxID=2650926 RepID=UPI0039E471E8
MAQSRSDIQPPGAARDVQPTPAAPHYFSDALFGSGTEIRIEHKGAVYTLRMTRSGGLILNK